MDFLKANKIEILVFSAILLLVILNYSIVLISVNNDFFGLFASIILFAFSSKTTTVKTNYLLIFLIIILQFVCYRLHTKTLHFLSISLFACLLFTLIKNKFSTIAFVCILLFSPIFNNFFLFLSTEIKQNLCYYAFLALKNFIHIDKIEGVNFYINQSKITIDTACMGLSMLKTGLLTTAILLSVEEKKAKKYFSIYQILIFCCIAIILNIISNYFRIIILVLVNCTHDNFLHHSIGILCFAIYQLLPMFYIIRFFNPKNEQLFEEISNKIFSYLISILLFLILIITSLEIKKTENNSLLQNLNPKYNIKCGKWINNEVFKFVSNDTLVYIKTPSHKPLICWTGDGYIINESKTIKVKNEEIWMNKMSKNNQNYISIWWYESENKKYTSFTEIMIVKLLQNKPIRLINETYLVKK